MGNIARAGGCAWLVGAACVALAATVACGSDGEETGSQSGGSGGTGTAGTAGSAGTSGTGGSAGTAGTGGAGGSAGSGDSLTLIVAADESTPLAGAIVAFDEPGGARVEKTTGADGKVTFDGIDWSAGSAAVTGYLDGYTLHSRVNLDEESVGNLDLVQDAVPLWLSDTTAPTPPATITVTGSVEGMLDTSHGVVVNVVGVLTGSEWSGSANGTFSVAAPSGEPFTLQVLEVVDSMLPSGQGYNMDIFQVAAVPMGASTNDVTDVVLDMTANLVTTQKADVTVSTPTRPDSPVRTGLGVGLVCPLNSLACTGWSTHIDISSDGNHFEDSFLWHEPSWATDVVTLFRVYDGNNLAAYYTVPSWPTAGDMGAIPDTPSWVTPAQGASHSVYDPFEWALNNDDVPTVQLYVRRGQSTVWIIDAGADATSATIPALPTTADPDSLLGIAPSAFVAEGWPNADESRLEAYTLSKTVTLTP